MPGCWFWRSQDRLEVDPPLEVGGRCYPVEIKLTATPTTRHVQPLTKIRELIGPSAEPGLLVCRVPEATPLPGDATAIPWQAWPTWLAQRPSAAR